MFEKLFKVCENFLKMTLNKHKNICCYISYFVFLPEWWDESNNHEKLQDLFQWVITLKVNTIKNSTLDEVLLISVIFKKRIFVFTFKGQTSDFYSFPLYSERLIVQVADIEMFFYSVSNIKSLKVAFNI